MTKLKPETRVEITGSGYGVPAGSSGRIRSVHPTRRTLLIEVTHNPGCVVRDRNRLAFAVSPNDVTGTACR